MANTVIAFTTDAGAILPNHNWVALGVGDTLTFEAPGGPSAPVIFFSPDLISILQPAPPQHLTVGTGAVLPVFTITAAQSGSYTIVVGSSPEFPPFFPERASTNLFFESLPAPVGSPYIPPFKSGS